MKKLLSLALSLVIAFSIFTVPLSVEATEYFKETDEKLAEGTTNDGWKYIIRQEDWWLDCGTLNTYAFVNGYVGTATKITIPTKITTTVNSQKTTFPVKAIVIG